MPSTRQLAAIIFTDIVGYTALMGEDEKKAFELLSKNRQIQKPIIEEFNGRFIKELGDGILASFNTVSDAVNAAIKIQDTCNRAKVFSLRIGIHHGEVVFEQDDIFGDAVNIASRIQTLGVPGSILFSKKVNDEIKNKSEFQTVSLGSFDFKNVREPLEVFALANKGLTVPKREQMSGKLKKEVSKKKKLFRKNFAIAASVLIALLAGVLLYTKYFNRQNIVDKSIAVLPFVNMSNDKNQEYFSDGLSEELLNLLAKIPELKVIGRTSSFSFKGKNEDLRSIAQKLGVAHILEGSVRKEGNNIRVNAQLIKATDGSNLWSETYDRELEGVFKVQDEIAEAVVKHLKLSLLAIPSNTNPPSNTEAYNLLLQGNYFSEKRDKKNVAKALEFYLQALALDSLNARAWAAVAICYDIQASWGWTDEIKGFQEAKKAAIKAITLDDKQAEGHRALGEAKMYDYNWEGAEAEFKKALYLEPGNPDAMRSMGILATAMGNLDKSIAWYKQSLSFDPIKPITYWHLGVSLNYANRLDEAIVSFKKILELNPQFPRLHVFLGQVYLLKGNPGMALAETQQETDQTYKDYGMSLAYQALGRRKEADEALKNYIATFQKSKSLEIAEIYAFRGEKDKAFEWLEKAYKDRAIRLIKFKNDPLFKNLESDPRFTAFLKKMNLPLD